MKFLPHVGMNSWIWRFLEERVYAMPNPPPPRVRTKPLEVICPGPPRSGSESLQRALLRLGFDYTYHGWDIVYDDECHSPGWVALCRKKFFGADDGDVTIAAAEFDALMGHATAVTDAAASVFAAELVAAFPDAKVVLNTRRDLDGWHESTIKTLVHANQSWGFYLASMLDRECFWAWHVYERFLWPLLFRASDGDMATAIRKNGKWIYREHCNMIRGLVPPDRLLEWSVEDGWEPLCKFLGKDVPDEPFPHLNAAGGGWKAREEQCNKRWVDQAMANLILIVLSLMFGLAGIVAYRLWA